MEEASPTECSMGGVCTFEIDMQVGWYLVWLLVATFRASVDFTNETLRAIEKGQNTETHPKRCLPTLFFHALLIPLVYMTTSNPNNFGAICKILKHCSGKNG